MSETTVPTKRTKFTGVQKFLIVALIWAVVFIAGFVEMAVFKHFSNFHLLLMLFTVFYGSWKAVVYLKRGIVFVGTGGKSF
jgi:hypothetical protein